jgi:TusA-related sulfurtransferase
MTEQFNYCLDITNDVCPMTFVRAKLLIEKMTAGQVAEIRLQGTEPLTNVPKSLAELGHEIVSIQAEDSEAAHGPHRLVVRKK